MEVNNCLKKIKLLFNCMFDGKIVMNEDYADQLLIFFEDDNEKSPARILLETPEFFHLIVESLERLNDASIQLKVFVVKLILMLLRNKKLIKMQAGDLHALSFKTCILDNLNDTLPHSLHLACLQLATELLTNSTGVNLIVKHELWQKILSPTIHHKPKQITNTAYNFMAKLVWNLNDSNMESVLSDVLEYILKPILSSGYLSIPLLDNDIDALLSDEIYGYLNALLAVLTEADNHIHTSNKVKSLMKNHVTINHHLFSIYRSCRNSHLSKLLSACLFRYGLLIFRYLLYNDKTDMFCISMAALHRNVVMNALNSRKYFAVIDYVVQSTITWSNFEKTQASVINFPLKFVWHGQELEFSTQILSCFVVPIVRCFITYRIINQISISDIDEQFFIKLVGNVSDYIFTIGRVFSLVLLEMDLSYRKRLTTYTLKELLKLKGHLSEFQAGLLFQALYYLLEIFVVYDNSEGMILHESINDPIDLGMLTPLLSAIKMLLKEYNISWYTNVEIVNIQAHLLSLLKQNFLTSRHIVQVLDLIDICVKKFLSPTMSLLVDNESTKSSTLNEIGRVIKSYMQHTDWEVRDSALNILKSCTELSFIKYISFRKIIIENSLIVLAAKAGLTSTEFYPQCTALQCLTAAAKIDSLWQEILEDNSRIYLQLVYLLRNHGEGIVRKEAAHVLTAVYIHQNLTPSIQNTLYKVMLSAALDDLHWEVQVAGLSFWKAIINKLLTSSGMLDGRFPPVTFSKEKRKIVILNKEEIQRQLTDIMIRLSRVGCLTVLLGCMDEINNTKVIDQAHCIIKQLIGILDTYDFKNRIEYVVAPVEENFLLVNSLDEDFNKKMDLSYSSEEERDKVIDSIFRLSQSELILNLHSNYCPENSTNVLLPQRSLVQPNMFIEYFRNNNYDIIVNGKTNCHAEYVSTLELLLDEILDL